MKKIILSAVVVCIALGFALPAMAVDVDFSGHLRTEGIYHDNSALTSGTKVSDAYYQGRFRLKSVFKVNDNVSITTRFDALEKMWGKSDEPKIASNKTSQYFGTLATFSTMATVYNRTMTYSAESDDNIDFEWAYMTLKTPVGGFLVGRMSGGAWGLTFGDDEGPRDRIVYVLPLDKWVFAAVAEKYEENDGDNTYVLTGTSSTGTDADRDKYYLTATYHGDDFTFGMLYGFYNYKFLMDMYQKNQAMTASNNAAAAGKSLTTYVADGSAAAAGLNTSMLNNNSSGEGQAHVFSPYFKGKFGPLGIEAEAAYSTAKGKYDSAYYTSTGVNTANSDSKTATLLTYMGEVNYDLGPLTIGGGYAYSSGDANWDDDKIEAQGFFAEGADWEKTLIMFSTEANIQGTLGGIGNMIGTDTLSSWYGYKAFFLQADYDVNENMNIGVVYASSKADDVPTGWDDDHGSEIDLKATWKFLDNVTWSGVAAMFNPGDFYKAGVATADPGDTYCLFTRLIVEF